jgi:hypothetical protein
MATVATARCTAGTQIITTRILCSLNKRIAALHAPKTPSQHLRCCSCSYSFFSFSAKHCDTSRGDHPKLTYARQMVLLTERRMSASKPVSQ